MRTPARRARALALTASLALGLAACGSDEERPEPAPVVRIEPPPGPRRPARTRKSGEERRPQGRAPDRAPPDAVPPAPDLQRDARLLELEEELLAVPAAAGLVELSLAAPADVAVGVPFVLEVVVHNTSLQPLEGLILTDAAGPGGGLLYLEDSLPAARGTWAGSLPAPRREVGDLAPGERRALVLRVVATRSGPVSACLTIELDAPLCTDLEVLPGPESK